MRFTKLLLATVTFAAFATPAAAATLLKFRLTGDVNASWIDEASPETVIEGFGAFSRDRVGTLEGVPNTPFRITFTTLDEFESGPISGAIVLSVGDDLPLFVGFGDLMFDRNGFDPPVFRRGEFRFIEFFEAKPNGVLTISAIPEPASWALMIAGFGLVGSALRRRQVAAAA